MEFKNLNFCENQKNAELKNANSMVASISLILNFSNFIDFFHNNSFIWGNKVHGDWNVILYR